MGIGDEWRDAQGRGLGMDSDLDDGGLDRGCIFEAEMEHVFWGLDWMEWI